MRRKIKIEIEGFFDVHDFLEESQLILQKFIRKNRLFGSIAAAYVFATE